MENRSFFQDNPVINDKIKILFYGISNKETILNYDFLINDIIPKKPNTLFNIDILTFEESINSSKQYDIFIYHCISPERLAHFGYSPTFENVKAAVKRHRPKVIIQLIDEYWFEHNEIHNSLGNYCNLFLRQHRHHCQLETYTDNTLQLPLGYINNYYTKTKYIKLPEERLYNWAWAGNIKSDRQEMINAFLGMPKGVIGINNALRPSEVFDLYNNSIFVPCGRGNDSLECWRNYEAAVSGAIPVIVGTPEEIECTFAFTDLPPFIYAKTWQQASEYCLQLVNDLDNLYMIQTNIRQWWRKTINNIQNQIKIALEK
jgi:hypothetical protein